MKILKILISIIIYIFTYQLSNANINLTVSPIKYEIDTQTGSIITKKATLYNRSNEEHFITTGKSDFQSKNQSGNPQFVRKSELVFLDQELSSWITIDTESFTIAPGEEKDINFTITVPDNATPGGHYGAVFFKKANSEVSNGANVGINVDYGILILVNVDGNIITDGNVENVSINSSGGSWGNSFPKKDNCKFGDLTNSNYDGKCIDDFFGKNENNIDKVVDIINKKDDSELIKDDFKIEFETLFINKGNTHLKPEGKIELIDENGKEIKGVGRKIKRNKAGAIIGEEIVDYLPINDVGGNILPGTKRNFESEWKGFPYKDYDENGNQIIKYWTPEEYYTRQNGLLLPKSDIEKRLYPWERINEKINDKKITANFNFKYINIDGEEVEFNSAKEFNVIYKEKYIGINPYFIICISLIILILFLLWIIFKKKKIKCKKCKKKIDKDMKICPYCGTKQKKKSK